MTRVPQIDYVTISHNLVNYRHLNDECSLAQAEQLELEKEQGIKNAATLRETLVNLEKEKDDLVAERNSLLVEKERLSAERGKY